MVNNVFKKQILRKRKREATARAQVRALPSVPRIMLSPGYVNPVTLEFPKKSIIVYEITNRRTGRKDYFDKETFWKLARRAPNNYWLLTADPTKPLPGVRNPMTRSNVFPRNVRRVTVGARPSPTKAAKKVASVWRKKTRKSH